MVQRLPPPESYAVAGERIRCLCALYNASVTSHGRTIKRNAQIGGDSESKHQIHFGLSGWDLVADRIADAPRLADSARTLGFWVLVEDDHVHVQSLAPGPDSHY
jgi:hypothetical protein